MSGLPRFPDAKRIARKVWEAPKWVVAVCRGKAVARLEQRYERAASRFLTDTKMIVADELVLVREPQHGLLEPADQQHLFEQWPTNFSVQRFGHDVPQASSLFRWFGFPDSHVIRCYRTRR